MRAETENLNIIATTPLFWKNYFSTKYLVVNRGGSRSGKTFSITQLLARWLVTGELRHGQKLLKGRCSVVRKTLPALKRSALRDFEENLALFGYLHIVKRNKTELTYTYQDRCVEFFSVDNAEKVKGQKRNILYINEATEVFFKTDFIQLMIRTAGGCVFLDFNPCDPYTWLKTEIEDKRQYIKKDVQVILSNYKDNPYLSKEQISELLAIEDENLRKVYIYGEYGLLEGLVFRNWQIVKKMPPLHLLKRVAGGLDFGFNDPSALIIAGVSNKRIFVDCPVYCRGLTTKELTAKIKKFLEFANINKNLYIYADSSQPATIKHLRSSRVNCRAVKKYKGSIVDGINILKNYKIFVTARSLGLIKELNKYSWKKGSDGDSIEGDPIDAFNHAIDALRYYAISKLKGKFNKIE